MNSSQTTTACSSSPRVPLSGQAQPEKKRERITPQIAAQRAHVSVWTIYRLLNSDAIQGERPSPGKIIIYADTLETHLRATRDPEFWESHSLAS